MGRCQFEFNITRPLPALAVNNVHIVRVHKAPRLGAK